MSYSRPILFIFVLALLFQCKSDKVDSTYSEYLKLDKVVPTESLFSPKKKITIPLAYNQVYDPFIDLEKMTNQKAVFEEGEYSNISIIVLDSIPSSMNISNRKKKERWVKALPVIIKNISETDTNHLLIHRGGALITQEAKTKDNKWVEVERLTKERIGKFYYKINPKEYIYTKSPLYKGSIETTFRIKLTLSDTSFIYSNEYKGYIQQWMLRK